MPLRISDPWATLVGQTLCYTWTAGDQNYFTIYWAVHNVSGEPRHSIQWADWDERESLTTGAGLIHPTILINQLFTLSLWNTCIMPIIPCFLSFYVV